MINEVHRRVINDCSFVLLLVLLVVVVVMFLEIGCFDCSCEGGRSFFCENKRVGMSYNSGLKIVQKFVICFDT